LLANLLHFDLRIEMEVEEISHDDAFLCDHFGDASLIQIEEALRRISYKNVECQHPACLKLNQKKNKAPKKNENKKNKKSKQGKKDVEEDIQWNQEIDLKQLHICLSCGNIACGRDLHRHAVLHFESSSQPLHSLAVNLESKQTWCYQCDKFVLPNNENENDKFTNRNFNECINEIIKAFPNINNQKNSSENTQSKEKKEINSMNHQNENLPVSGVGIKGLTNLGNTCFFNAVMQNLTTIIPLRDYLMTNGLQGEGPVTTALRRFMSSMWSSGKGTVTPKELFSEIAKKSPQFRGYHQQDSHELLRALFDNIDIEEKKKI